MFAFQKEEYNKMMNSPYQKLAWAIILKAVKDYRKAMKEDNRKTKRECERFFRSGWFQKLTTIDGERLIQKLRAEVTV